MRPPMPASAAARWTSRLAGLFAPRPAAAPACADDGGAHCIFVSGVMRSGTTVVQRVVAHSLATDYIREECALRIPVESFVVLDQHQAYPLLGRASYLAQYQRFLAGMLGEMQGAIDGEVLVLKDPLSLKSLPAFLELLPTSRFIITVRNPLATAASIYRVRNRQREQGRQSFIAPMDFGDIVEYLARLCEVIISLRGHARVCLVPYEGLIGRDPVVLRQLGEFIGAAVRLDLPDDSAAYDRAHAFWTEESGGAIRPSSLDKHAAMLTADETALVRTRLAHFCTVFGYS